MESLTPEVEERLTVLAKDGDLEAQAELDKWKTRRTAWYMPKQKGPWRPYFRKDGWPKAHVGPQWAAWNFLHKCRKYEQEIYESMKHLGWHKPADKNILWLVVERVRFIHTNWPREIGNAPPLPTPNLGIAGLDRTFREG